MEHDAVRETEASQLRKLMPLLTLPPERLRPAVGIITALPEEYASVKALLQNPRHHEVPGRGADRRYLLGQIPAANGGTLTVVLSLMTDMGNNIAGVRATLLLEHFPNVKFIIFGTPEGTTFYLAPVNPLANCRVGCQVRIIDDGGNADNWVGFRVRGFAFDIRLGYLVYLRRSGRVELHRGHEIIAGTDEQVVDDTRNKWTEIRMDIFEDKIWLLVNNVPYRFIRDRKFCDEGNIYLHTFGTHSEFRDFYVYELKKSPQEWNT